MHDGAWHGMERGKVRHITTMHDGIAQHGMAKDNMTHITAMHDGMAQHAAPLSPIGNRHLWYRPNEVMKAV
jgi:hypothetical protein